MSVEHTYDRFIAAAGPLGGTVRSLYGDGAGAQEPLEDVCKALLDIGVQPETVEALRSKTLHAAAKRRARALDAVEHLRKALDSDEDVLTILDPRTTVLFHGAR